MQPPYKQTNIQTYRISITADDQNTNSNKKSGKKFDIVKTIIKLPDELSDTEISICIIGISI